MFRKNINNNTFILTMLAMFLFQTNCSQVGQYNTFSTDEEILIGQRYSSQIEKDLSINQNTEINRYINEIGQKLVAVSKRNNIQFTFKFVKENAVNAFALPGGFCYVNTGLILFSDNESQLSSVISHQIGHVVAAHSAKRMSKSRLINQVLALGEILGMIFIGQSTTENALIVADIASTGALLKYSRNDELEADRLAIQQMHDAGINPKGSQQFFKKISSKDTNNSTALDQIMSTHPATEDRIKQAAKIIEKLPNKNYATITNKRLNKIKELLETADTKN